LKLNSPLIVVEDFAAMHAAGVGVRTEELRLTLQRYRSFFGRLLEV
jgi:hypothetical protein